ncbi:MAG: response regulator, partial [Ignavibacteriales bacterium]|nr:response regulator [Ignavibacteriales bacterium]
TSGVHFLANDIANNPEMMPWRENALTHGYKSSAAFPIKVFGKTIGAFMLYSSETFFFDGDEVKLFDEMVMDISFALEKSETEKKINVAEIKLLKSEKRFNKLVTELNDIVWTASLDGTEIVDVNNSIETVCGITVDEFKTNPKLWLEMVHPDDRHTAEASSKELLENGKNQAEYRIIKPDGSVVWLLDIKTLIFNEEGIPVQRGGIVKDITTRKLAEQGLIIANAELTIQNEEKEKRAVELVIANAELAFQNEEKEKRAAELLVAIEKAGEMNRLKSNFLANMSNELRTPLIGINGYADFLRKDIVEPELKEMAETIFISGNRLTETINLILDLSKFESEKVEFNYQNVDIVNETGNIINLFKEAARKKSIDLQSAFSQPSIFCHTDEQAFRSVLNNLVNNAIKYTYEGCVAVNLSQNSTSVEIKVTDTGIGIPKEFHEIIFDEFRQVSEGLNRNFEGTGIGLNVTKRIVEKFNGEVSVESESGRGSTFTVKLPFIDKSENKGKETVIEEALTVEIIEQKSVKPLGLLVDDDPFIYPLLRRYITKQVNLENAKDGESAIKLCMQKQYDIVFMDINLRRGLDGTEVTQIIRKIKGYESIPIIATTAYAMDGDKEEFIAAGCSHYMSKPFSQKDALDLLEEIQNNLRKELIC